MRVWLDAKALAARNLTVDDVDKALLSQNIELPGGSIETAQRETSLRLLEQQAGLMPEVAGRIQACMEALERQQQALNERLTADQARFYRETESAYTALAASVERTLTASAADSAARAGAAIQPAIEAALAGLARQGADLHEGMAHQVRGDNIRFTVYDLTGEVPIPAGIATLLPDSAVRTAEYVVMLAPEARGRGLGTATTGLVLDYGFHITNLRMIWLKVLAPNTAAVHAYEKAGFVIEGRQREHAWVRGRYEDNVLMGILRSEWAARRGHGE